MTAQLIDGRGLAAEIEDKLRERIAAYGKSPQLAVILAGNDDASLIYVRNKQKAAEKTGIRTQLYHLPEDVRESDILALIERLNNDSDTNGIIVQLPLPAHLQAAPVINSISPLKDVDGFHPYNTGLLQNNEVPHFIAATPLGVLKLIKTVCPEPAGKNAVIIGASLIVGRPLAALLLNQSCTVTVTHSLTCNIKELTSGADILISACGVPNLVKKDWIKNGAVLIDVGINRINGKLCGDIDFEDVKEKASAITPVPGGVGPMTIAMLLQNTVHAAELQKTV